jgi:cytochrome c oxidase cbb3-type subunit 2
MWSISRRAIFLVVMSGLLTLSGTGTATADATDALAQGKAVYLRECQMCHGAKGDGQGPGAFLLSTPPRDFTASVFKFRTTPSGAPPTDADLLRTITMGLPGSMMPSFRELPDSERRAVLEVVKQFAGITQVPPTVTVPPEPPITPAALARGQKLFVDLQCVDCHGAQGRGDGPLSLTLKSDDGHRIWPRDLVHETFKGGTAGKDIYLRIATGIDGTPMTPFAEAVEPEDLWAVVHFVRSLSSASAK